MKLSATVVENVKNIERLEEMADGAEEQAFATIRKLEAEALAENLNIYKLAEAFRGLAEDWRGRDHEDGEAAASLLGGIADRLDRITEELAEIDED